MTLDALIEYDFDEAQAQEMIDSVSEAAQEKIDWNRVWSKKYPVLSTYHKTVRVEDYAPALGEMLTQLQVDYGYSHTDAVLVLKDILARVWKGNYSRVCIVPGSPAGPCPGPMTKAPRLTPQAISAWQDFSPRFSVHL